MVNLTALFIRNWTCHTHEHPDGQIDIRNLFLFIHYNPMILANIGTLSQQTSGVVPAMYVWVAIQFQTSSTTNLGFEWIWAMLAIFTYVIYCAWPIWQCLNVDS
ncbi:hypothetical protein DERF_014282 [Dermatophagoides farinae]|uniref:Uncharacterized protein n=1 Tax=Dermatophagoides farinae TaxID=6954 RepID=A0A922KU13_DERFA|nr:hypothetical protein DERF_014282 [Dermatophagoides farinae]